MKEKKIILKGVKEHNLKNIDLTLEGNRLFVFTGVSGSGKSSLAFDTLYREGQRRYVESLSTYVRKHFGDLARPDIESAEGLSPTISIEQKTVGKNPRSTVGTLTEIYDYLRVLFARVAIAYCPVSGEKLQPQSREKILNLIELRECDQTRIILAPLHRDKKGEFREEFADWLRRGYTRVRVDGKLHSLTEPIELERNLKHNIDLVIDRLTIRKDNHSRLAESVFRALELGAGLVTLWDPESGNETLFSTLAYSPESGLSYPALQPHDFSFNSPSGMCPTCQGLGMKEEFDLEKVIDPNKSIAEDCCLLAGSYQTVKWGNVYRGIAKRYHFSVDTPWKKLSEDAKKIYLYGSPEKWIEMTFVHPDTGAKWRDYVHWKGVFVEAHEKRTQAKSDFLTKKLDSYLLQSICPDCLGARLKPYPAASRLASKTLHEISQMTSEEALEFFQTLTLNDEEATIAAELLKEIKERLNFLLNVGLGYLSLERTAPTLSGGEAQRVRLASQIGSGLVGITYILDEPSIGLHPRDNKKLIQTLRALKDAGNTVIVVEHDEETILSADEVVDFGPGASKLGGHIVYQGPVDGLLKCEPSLTGAYLSGRLEIPTPKSRRKPDKKRKLQVTGVSHNNLKNVTLNLPLGLFVAVTGVSGSGKSSLISDVLFPTLQALLDKKLPQPIRYASVSGQDLVDKIISIDQSAIGRNPRSNPATYVKLFDDIRDLFSQLPDSRAKGFSPGRFSFNVKHGSCPECQGMGMVRVDMDFMEETWVDCGECHGKRFDPETLSVTYKGKNIHDILQMDAKEGAEFFAKIPTLKKKLDFLQSVGLDYLALGQPSPTLSGGEAQRIKLAKELSRPTTGKTVYILDEPTTGLHFHDVKKLLEVLHRLVDQGNTVVVIEHNMEVVKTADWIIELGPEGGSAGGSIIAEGTPETIKKKKTATGEALNDHLTPTALPPAKTTPETEKDHILLEGAEENNLKHLSIELPRDAMVVFTGPSGSGKSSLAFDTLYREGQRRYAESLSPYARQFVKIPARPKLASAKFLSPAIALEQKAHAGNPRSTVGTLTEIYDYLRVLFAALGIPHCPETGEPIRSITEEYVATRLLETLPSERAIILAPLELKKGENFPILIERLQRSGYLRLRLNGNFHLLDEPIPFDPKSKNKVELVIDRLTLDAASIGRLREALEAASKWGEKQLIVNARDTDYFYNLDFCVESTGRSYPLVTPHTFSFNRTEGMCPSCLGLGVQFGVNFLKDERFLNFSFFDLIRALFVEGALSKPLEEMISVFLKKEKIVGSLPIRYLPEEDKKLIFDGSTETVYYSTNFGFSFQWLGLQQTLAKSPRSCQRWLKDAAEPFLEEFTCPSCTGSRLNPIARAVTIEGKSLPELVRMPLEEASAFFESLALPTENKTLEEALVQVKRRLGFLVEVGLGYLGLDRTAKTLSGGESERIRLARQLGTTLRGILYVLDEPTTGLHPKDTTRLLSSLKKLRDLGNTLVLVEHDPLVIEKADRVYDFGPGAGVLGGHIVAEGTPEEIRNHPDSLTGKYLSGRLKIAIPEKRRKPVKKQHLTVKGASLNNLKNITTKFPVGAFTALTGVSGSGKSTLLEEIIRKGVEEGLGRSNKVDLPFGKIDGIDHFKKLILVTQDPIGHTNRSDVGTYVELLEHVRAFFAKLPAAKIKGLTPGHFSYNHRLGMCSGCSGLGYKRIDMHFLPTVTLLCPDCNGLRLNPLSLEVEYKGKNFGQYLQETVVQARLSFENHPKIVKILDTLISVGLGYLTLGQEVATLSGGEAQRIKLSREIAKRSSGKTLYLLDEPSSGLHFDDMKNLLHVIESLVEKGNTVIAIEHNLEMIKCADYVIELGPEAGEKGGYLIAEGTPEALAANRKSVTGPFLLPLLK